MTSRKETILKAAKRTAHQAKQAASNRGKKIRSMTVMEPHRHCVVCWKPIPLEAEPAICEEVSCSSMHDRRERSRKMFTITMYLGIAIFVGLLAFQIILGASA
tara:strand:+ start:339 stop:647 length:309 start_codon:yes stop_codon:yes gene_type:complete